MNAKKISKAKKISRHQGFRTCRNINIHLRRNEIAHETPCELSLNKKEEWKILNLMDKISNRSI